MNIKWNIFVQHYKEKICFLLFSCFFVHQLLPQSSFVSRYTMMPDSHSLDSSAYREILMRHFTQCSKTHFPTLKIKNKMYIFEILISSSFICDGLNSDVFGASPGIV